MCCARPVGVTGSGRHRIRGQFDKNHHKKINVLSGQFAELTAFTNLLKKAFSQVVEKFVAIRIGIVTQSIVHFVDSVNT